MIPNLLVLLSLSFLLSGCDFFKAADNGGNREDAQDNPDEDPRDPNRNTRAITADDMPLYLNSQMFRAQDSTIYKEAQIAKFMAPGSEETLPNTLFPVPDKIVHDMDRNTTRPNRPESCGWSFPADTQVNIATRIADCRAKNPDNFKAHTWSGKENGLAGEGRWRLVVHRDGKSLWEDTSTGLLWSPPTVERNWDRASGNVNDPLLAVCNGASDIANKTGYFLGVKADEVAWRLPTRNDYLQADINGSRFVLSIEGDDDIYWTANYISEGQDAWAIQHSTGMLSKRDENTPTNVRCVGVVIK